ncbi:hypothetical protein MCAP1_001142 [Malassezia caprae]|uniref:Major facilitator superfamily (MFS) profile domain-containing protein n=1 Tax=Malassezia caprae TaxID=1381934 RepID=A0AAF0E659_9BASI|nr:hypothetical protein MCAP1_001142 [Malassezia caprae]
MSRSVTPAPLRTDDTFDMHDSSQPPVSFKRRSWQVSAGGLSSLRRWVSRDSYRNSSAFTHRMRESGVPEGWEHPSRYAGASHVTMPSILPAIQSAPQSNPLPFIPYTVVCLLIFGEFCSSGVAGPFLFFMLESFQIGDESRVGFWAGIVASTFFFAQFLTSLMWASVAEKHGRRFVLQLSMVGNSLALVAFGLSGNLWAAILFRFAQGFFNGAVGVAKGAVRDLADESNEGRAYAQMGFWWGMGGIVGPILGGVLEHPADKYPWLFGRVAFLKTYPYFLPCLLAGSSTIVGALLSLWLEPDGSVRGSIRLDDHTATLERADSVRDPSPGEQSDWSVPASHMSRGRLRHMDPTHWPQAFGPRPVSQAGSVYDAASVRFQPSSQLRSESSFPGRNSFFGLDHDEDGPGMSILERFVLANDDAMHTITDLWVAAAANTDESLEDPDTIEEAEESVDEEAEEQDDDAAEAPPLLGASLSQELRRPSGSYVPPSHFVRAKMQREPSGASVDDTERLPLQAEAETNDSSPMEAAVSPLWLLPLVVIVHYGVLSFHSAMFDQVFMSFLVTPVPSGGLGLTAGHYALLIAAMTLCQVLFQFQLYPNLGPPNGRFSHLAVLQVGVLLYLPCYVLFPWLRTVLMPNTDVLVMAVMILFATLRWLANILSFTSVTVLLNAWTPPHLVPLANGLAQTTSSLARFVGPILGGMVWARSIQGGPYAHAWPFNFHLGFWVVGLVAAMGALHAQRMKEMLT